MPRPDRPRPGGFLRVFGSQIGRWQRFVRPSSVPVALAFLVVCAASIYADVQNQLVFQQQLRARVFDQLSLVRAKLEGNVSGDVQLVRGLVATLETEPNMDQQRFAALASNLLDHDAELREVAGAPGLVVSLLYPVKGNERSLGLNYLETPGQRDAVLRARDTGKLVLAGPVDLVQGGRALIARFPVFLPEQAGAGRQFWGVVSAVIDVDQLYRDSGLLDPALGIDVTIAGEDALGAMGKPFYGDTSIRDDRAVTTRVALPMGSWQLAARPKAGWDQSPPNTWWLRLAILIADIMVLVPILIATRLVEERLVHMRELRLRENELRLLSQRLRLALDASRVGVWDFDIVTGELLWDNRMNELYGYAMDDGPRGFEHWRNALHPDDLERALADFQAAIDEAGEYRSVYRVVTMAGEVRTIRAIGAVYAGANGEAKIVGVNWDVSDEAARSAELQRAKAMTEARNAELEAAKRRIEHNALHDSLTGLPNRRFLDDILFEHATHCAGEPGSVALLHIDLDRFKEINDTLGHAAGDAMLIHASDILKANAGPADFVARIGGDEFVVVRLAETTETQLARLAQRIIVKMRRPVVYQGHECRFGVSIGIAEQSGRYIDPIRLLVNADVALYEAKRRGRNRHEFFDEALQTEIENRKRLADDILGGLERREFVPFYQPQFDARTLDIVGVEALVRWRHPREGWLAPAAFLHIAEELNVVAAIDRLILEQGLLDMNKWRAAGIDVPRLSVNVSGRRLRDENLIPTLRQLAIPPGMVAFELVESIYLDESDNLMTWNLDNIKELGIDIEIDDFGTGYASIVSLMKLRPRRLKIDRQLVLPITTSPAQRQLISSIVEIGKSLGIEIVAEGVETPEHAMLLRDLGCHVLQGYALSRPMPAGDMVAFVSNAAWRAAG